jgi:excisionase family DNA binding protein
MNEQVSPKQLARAIQVSESSVKRWCDQGVISTVRTAGGHRRIPVADVLRFLRDNRYDVVRPELLGLPATVGRSARVRDRAVEQLREALLGGFAQSRILDLHGQRVIDRNFEPGFKVKLHRKDMNIALQTSRDLSVPLHGSAIVAAQVDALLAQGDGELDHSALVLLLEQMSNVVEK